MALSRPLRQPIYLLEECSLPPGPLAGKEAPTNSKVLRKIKGHHKFLQESSGNTSSYSQAFRLTCNDIIEWWERTGIALKGVSAIIKMTEKLHSDWLKLYRVKDKPHSDAHKQKLMDFNELAKEVFWVPCPKFEKKLETSIDPDLVEDREYLKKVKAREDGATMGPLDTKRQKKMARKMSGRDISRPSTSQHIIIEYPDESQEEDDGSSEDQEDPDDPRVKRHRASSASSNISTTSTSSNSSTSSRTSSGSSSSGKSRMFSKALCVIADKHQIPHRALAELSNQFLADQGQDIDDWSSSISTSRRLRNATRVEVGENFAEEALRKCSEPGCRATLHWDGKQLKSLYHTRGGGNPTDFDL